MDVNPGKGSQGATLQRRSGHAYDERAFRHLLDVERKRAERSRRPILLLLVIVKKQKTATQRISPDVAAAIFSGLWLCVREVDFIGWFREGRAAGVVLSQGPEPHSADVPRRLGERIARALRAQVPETVANRLEVRVLELRPSDRERNI